MKCLKNSECNSNFCDNGICNNNPAEYNPCKNGKCSGDYICDPYTKRCRLFPTEEDQKGSCYMTALCPPNYYCDVTRCRPAGDEGSVCKVATNGDDENFCKDGLECLANKAKDENKKYDDYDERGKCRHRCFQDSDCPTGQVCGKRVQILDRNYKLCIKSKVVPLPKPAPEPASTPTSTTPSDLSLVSDTVKKAVDFLKHNWMSAAGVGLGIVLIIIILVIIKISKRKKSLPPANPTSLPQHYPSGPSYASQSSPAAYQNDMHASPSAPSYEQSQMSHPYSSGPNQPPPDHHK